MKNLNLISLLSLLLVMSFYRCDKQSDEFISDLDTTSFVEAFLAFVSGSGLRFDANPLKGAYTPPGEQDALGTPLLSFSQSTVNLI